MSMMDNIVDFTKFRQHRQAATPARSAFEDCLFTDTISDVMSIVDILRSADSASELNLTALERGQLDFLAVLADELAEHWARLGLDEIEEID